MSIEKLTCNYLVEERPDAFEQLRNSLDEVQTLSKW